MPLAGEWPPAPAIHRQLSPCSLRRSGCPHAPTTRPFCQCQRHTRHCHLDGAQLRALCPSRVDTSACERAIDCSLRIVPVGAADFGPTSPHAPTRATRDAVVGSTSTVNEHAFVQHRVITMGLERFEVHWCQLGGFQICPATSTHTPPRRLLNTVDVVRVTETEAEAGASGQRVG